MGYRLAVEKRDVNLKDVCHDNWREKIIFIFLMLFSCVLCYKKTVVTVWKCLGRPLFQFFD